jgi:co-chaperonin GroES (HSP10)
MVEREAPALAHVVDSRGWLDGRTVLYRKFAACEIDDEVLVARRDDLLAVAEPTADGTGAQWVYTMLGGHVLIQPIDTLGDHSEGGILLTETYRAAQRGGLDLDRGSINQVGVGRVLHSDLPEGFMNGCFVLFRYRHAVYLEYRGHECVIVHENTQSVLAVIPDAIMVQEYGEEILNVGRESGGTTTPGPHAE